MAPRIRGNAFVKNSLTLSGGVAVAQVLPFLFYPLLGRLFSAGEFGLLAAVTAIVSVLSVVGSGRYEAGILVAKSKREAARLAVLCVTMSVAVLVVSWAVLQFVLAEPLARWFKEPGLSRWLFVCPVAAFFVVVYNVYNEWCVREGYFKALGVNKIVNSGAIAVSKVLLGVVKICSQGLVVGDVIGRGISAAGCAVRAWMKDGRWFAAVRLGSLWPTAMRHKGYPLYTMPGQLLNALGQAAPVLMIAYFFDKTEVGYFSMAMTLFSVPINVVSSAIRDVYRRQANEEFAHQGSCLGSFRRVLMLLSVIGVAALLLLVWFLPELMELFMGAGWGQAGRYAQLLAPAMVIMFISNSLSGLFIVADKLRQFFWWQFYFAGVTLLSVWLGGVLMGSMEGVLILFAVGRATAYAASIVMTYRYAKGN